MWGSSNKTKKKEEEPTIGQENKTMFTKGSLRPESDMEEELSGGRTEAGTKENSDKDDNKVKAVSTDQMSKNNMKGNGLTECSTVKANNILKTDKSMKARSNRINSTEMASFTKKTP